MREDLAASPIDQFKIWLAEAITTEVIEPNAMALATSDTSGLPSSRMVLLKQADEKGFVFFTNLGSRKAQELSVNPNAAATIWWKELERQVNIEGSIEIVQRDDVEAYFARRPRESQIGAWASFQDAVLVSREELEHAFVKFERKFENQLIPPPSNWGGFRIVPKAIEFWQGRSSRLHDRFKYTLREGKWIIERLSP